jgi:hypothetical protein
LTFCCAEGPAVEFIFLMNGKQHNAAHTAKSMA